MALPVGISWPKKHTDFPLINSELNLVVHVLCGCCSIDRSNCVREFVRVVNVNFNFDSLENSDKLMNDPLKLLKISINFRPKGIMVHAVATHPINIKYYVILFGQTLQYVSMMAQYYSVNENVNHFFSCDIWRGSDKK